MLTVVNDFYQYDNSGTKPQNSENVDDESGKGEAVINLRKKNVRSLRDGDLINLTGWSLIVTYFFRSYL